jgi:transcriptional regulator with XRE-family HTH domain
VSGIDYASIGRRIKYYRTRMNLSQEEFASRIPVSRTYLSYLETGSRQVGLESLVHIANELGVSIEVLLEDSLEETSDLCDSHLLKVLLESFETKIKLPNYLQGTVDYLFFKHIMINLHRIVLAYPNMIANPTGSRPSARFVSENPTATGMSPIFPPSCRVFSAVELKPRNFQSTANCSVDNYLYSSHSRHAFNIAYKLYFPYESCWYDTIRPSHCVILYT